MSTTIKSRPMNKAPEFKDFWKAYPLHKARKQAEQAWSRLSARDKRAAIAALPAYTCDCLQRGAAFKYAHGWINGRRWEDELESKAPVLDDNSPKHACMKHETTLCSDTSIDDILVW